MKKLLLIVFALTSLSAFGLNLNIGINSNSGSIGRKDGLRVKNSTDFDKNVLGVQAEITQNFIIGEFGAGISFEPGYKLETGGDKFNQMPMYLLGRVNLFPVGVRPYVVGKVGKTAYSGDRKIDDGNYYAIGAGVTLIGMLQVEANYSLRDGKIGNQKVQSKIVSLSLSYNIF